MLCLIPLSEGFGQLRSLVTLSLSSCRQLKALPEGFGQLKSLVTLNLTNCRELLALPEGISSLSLPPWPKLTGTLVPPFR